FSSRRRHTRSKRDWSSDVCSSDLLFSPWYGPQITWFRPQQGLPGSTHRNRRLMVQGPLVRPKRMGTNRTHHQSIRNTYHERRTYLRGHQPHHPKNRLLHLRAHRRRNRCNPSRLLSSRTRTTNLAHRSISRVLFHWCSFRNHRRSEHPKTAYRNRTRHY